tara:strand:+ start:386 stop:505 length:120 start_codon:yes stop_codon:yes gene_type:complete
MNDIKNITEELQLIEEFESNFNPTPESQNRKLELLSILS